MHSPSGLEPQDSTAARDQTRCGNWSQQLQTGDLSWHVALQGLG